MTKEELEKEAEECMHNALYWLKLPISKENVEQGGSYILKLLEPREKRIAELEDKLANADYQLEGRDIKIKELEHQLTHRNCLDCSNHSSNLRMRTLELEKENAELKSDNTEWEKASDKWKSVYELTNSQLTKAKEIIKRLLATPRSIYGRDEDGEFASFFNSDYEELEKEAEQFLKDCEVNNALS